MKKAICLLSTIVLSAYAASANPSQAFKCSLSSAKSTDPDWKSQAFPLIKQSTHFESATSFGSSKFFDLTAIDPSQLSGWPQYRYGTYYSGNNDLYVIIDNGKVLQVVKPLETDINTQKRPSVYNCLQVQ
ncbi:MAG: hypothetical protein ACXVCY_03350 [Pseudobdellovibrionaceae bacterium]